MFANVVLSPNVSQSSCKKMHDLKFDEEKSKALAIT